MMRSRGDWREKFRTMVNAFDQLNKERAHIINNQGKQITQFARKINNFDANSKNAQKELDGMVKKFNEGNLFDNMNAGASLDQLLRSNAKT